MQDRIFYAICFGFGFGVLARSFMNLDWYVALLFGIISGVLILFFTLISINKWGAICAVAVLAFSLGILRLDIADKPVPEELENKLGDRVTFNGIVSDEPDLREDNQKLTVKIPQAKILATTNFNEKYSYGDEVEIIGELKKPENFLTDQGKEFDYVNYLKKDGILFIMSYPEIKIISHGHGNPVKRLLFAIKENFLEKISIVIPAPESLLMGGLILGERASFSDDLRQKFINTGTIHIVALSGYNVTIVAEWIMKFFSFLPRNWGFGVGILGIFLFVILSGGASTAIRAGIMASLVLVARATGRTYDVARALLFAGVIMIIFNPYVLAYDVSFQLSFIATVAVIFFAPRIEKYFYWVPERFGLRDIVAVTCAAYFFVLPFVLYKMGNLSLVALPANILVLPFIPLTMALGFFTGFLGIIWHALSAPVGLVSYWLLKYELATIGFFADFPLAAFTIPNFPLWITILIYVYFSWKLLGNFFRLLSS